MVIKIFYKGKEMAEVQEGQIKFHDKKADLNELINQSIPSIVEEEDDDGNVLLNTSEPPLENKLIFLKGLGFDIEGEI